MLRSPLIDCGPLRKRKETMDSLSGKVAVVTGGASGIGKSIVRALLKQGMKVAIADVEDDALAATVSEFADANNQLIPVKVDVTQADAVAAAREAVEAQLGPVQVVCNNAGVFVSGPIQQATQHDWDWVNGVNIQGVINVVQAFLPAMVASDLPGHIVNTASLAGHFAPKGLGVYNTGKYAVVGLTESLRADLEDTKVSVSALCPGVVRTNIGNAARNRPAALGETSVPRRDTDVEIPAGAEGVLEPDPVGEMVVQGILDDDLYIFSHPELRPIFETRVAGIQASFDRWQAYRDAQT